ncbi:PLP-dependent aminotransferase family protein [Anaerococcus urinomassiliensis]|uniref:hypothetical protein n=1 Tax=Anaerococcus urinomassiliensis TaxID=1745712 RepID=UPI001F19B886|nr:hypothetical protein [Anaerococcus urinomassiliensis]
MAKSFIPGIMFEAVFGKEDGYLEGARIAYQMAKDLATGIVEKGYDLAYPFESNQVFVKLSQDELKNWQNIAQFEIMGEIDGKTIARLVTTYRTSKSDIEGFLSHI